MTAELLPAGTRRWVAGKTCNAMTGLAIDRCGRTGSRACQVCEHRLDDVDGLGTHPQCDPSGTLVFKLLAASMTPRRLARVLAHVGEGRAGVIAGTDHTVTTTEGLCDRHHCTGDVLTLLLRNYAAEHTGEPASDCFHDAEPRAVIPLRLTPSGVRLSEWLTHDH